MSHNNAAGDKCFEVDKISDQSMLPSTGGSVQTMSEEAEELAKQRELEEEFWAMLDDYPDNNIPISYQDEKPAPKCVPYSEARTQLKRFNDEFCNKEVQKKEYAFVRDLEHRLYFECKAAFEKEICEASNYIHAPEDFYESVSGQEAVCLELLHCYDPYASYYDSYSY